MPTSDQIVQWTLEEVQKVTKRTIQPNLRSQINTAVLNRIKNETAKTLVLGTTPDFGINKKETKVDYPTKTSNSDS